jgi:hypothetical protein
MRSRVEDMQNVREMMVNYDGLSQKLDNFFFKNFITINNMNLRSKYFCEIIKFTSKKI